MRLAGYIPSTLTLIRMTLAVPLALWLWEGRIVAALGLLLAAGITDLLDGYLARKFGWRTVLGSWLDPAADKVLITTSLVILTAKAYLPLWFCVLTIGRDLGLVIGVLSLVGSGVRVKIRPLLSGKLATVAQNLTLLAAMLEPVWPRAEHFIPTMLLVSTATTVISSIAYAKTLASYRKAGLGDPSARTSP